MRKPNPSWTETKEVNGQELNLTFEIQDHGIGPFECHGVRGNQVSLGAVLTSVKNSAGEEIDLDDSVVTTLEDDATDKWRASREQE